MTFVISMPADLKDEWEEIIKDWLGVARRCQQMGACEQEGYAAVKMGAIVDYRGRPVIRIAPKLIKLEPKNRIKLSDLEAVAAFCEARGISILDVLDTLAG